jgi:hypothetical protein
MKLSVKNICEYSDYILESNNISLNGREEVGVDENGNKICDSFLHIKKADDIPLFNNFEIGRFKDMKDEFTKIIDNNNNNNYNFDKINNKFITNYEKYIYRFIIISNDEGGNIYIERKGNKLLKKSKKKIGYFKRISRDIIKGEIIILYNIDLKRFINCILRSKDESFLGLCNSPLEKDNDIILILINIFIFLYTANVINFTTFYSLYKTIYFSIKSGNGELYDHKHLCIDLLSKLSSIYKKINYKTAFRLNIGDDDIENTNNANNNNKNNIINNIDNSIDNIINNIDNSIDNIIDNNNNNSTNITDNNDNSIDNTIDNNIIDNNIDNNNTNIIVDNNTNIIVDNNTNTIDNNNTNIIGDNNNTNIIGDTNTIDKSIDNTIDNNIIYNNIIGDNDTNIIDNSIDNVINNNIIDNNDNSINNIPKDDKNLLYNEENINDCILDENDIIISNGKRKRDDDKFREIDMCEEAPLKIRKRSNNSININMIEIDEDLEVTIFTGLLFCSLPKLISSIKTKTPQGSECTIKDFTLIYQSCIINHEINNNNPIYDYKNEILNLIRNEDLDRFILNLTFYGPNNNNKSKLKIKKIVDIDIFFDNTPAMSYISNYNIYEEDEDSSYCDIDKHIFKTFLSIFDTYKFIELGNKNSEEYIMLNKGNNPFSLNYIQGCNHENAIVIR